MEKIDLRKKYKHLYQPPTHPVIVEVPDFNYLMIDGHGDPNTSLRFQDAMSCLYTVGFTIKFAVKKQQGIDFTVMGPEGLWWVENMAEFSLDRKDAWDWTLIMMQPEFVTLDIFEFARQQAKAKKNPALIDEIRFEPYHEGTVVQLMHIGPYSAEGPNIARMHDFARQQGYQLIGKHHEIYLSDVRRVAPEKLKTVLRQPITK